MPIHRIGNDPRREWSTVNSSSGDSPPPKGPKSLPYVLDSNGGAIESGMFNICAEAHITRLPMNEIPSSVNEVINKEFDFSPGFNGPMQIQWPGTSRIIDPGEYRRSTSPDWTLQLTENHYQIHDTGNQPNVPYLEDGCPEFGATARQGSNGTLDTTFPFRMSNEDFAQNMVSFSSSCHSLGDTAQPQPGNGEPCSDLDAWTLPMIPRARGDIGTGIPPTLYGFGDGPPVEAWHGCEPPSLMASDPGLPDHTRASQAPTRAVQKARDQKKECLGPMLRIHNMRMEDAEPRKRRCFSKSEKERINQVRKEGACQACKKKHKKCWHVALDAEELHAASPVSNGPETPVSDTVEDVQILSPSQSFDRDNQA